jgi:hypothetical protein
MSSRKGSIMNSRQGSTDLTDKLAQNACNYLSKVTFYSWPVKETNQIS